MALTVALAAALLEKLLIDPQQARRLRRLRQACLALIERDAHTFARAINATRQQRADGFRRALKAATQLQWQLYASAHAIQAICLRTQATVRPRFRSDLRCAQALARAGSQGAKTLIVTNLAWLRDARYTRQMTRRLQSRSLVSADARTRGRRPR